MATVVQEEKDPKVPLFLIAVPGFDPSGKVVEVASSLQKKCDALAMGNSDCYEVRRGPPSYFFFRDQFALCPWVHVSQDGEQCENGNLAFCLPYGLLEFQRRPGGA